MSAGAELTQNTVNFCRYQSPFHVVSEPFGRWHYVKDRRGVALCQCDRIDDAWVISEALNAVTGIPVTETTPALKSPQQG